MSVDKKYIRSLPLKPGVYKFSDEENNVLYIGKAKNLKNRVSSYFSSKSSHSGRIQIMVSKIDKIDYTVVPSEYDAWLLENSLIKKYQPKYNINLKDGKTYPFIAIKKERFPRVIMTRKMIRDGTKYYGPFVSYSNKSILLDLIHKYFRIRTCNFNLSEENIENKKFKVCLNFHIDICKGPCEGFQSEVEYLNNISKVEDILKGKTRNVIRQLKAQMQKASIDLKFEKAAELKTTIEALENFESKSAVVNQKINKVDVFSIYSRNEMAIVNYFKIVNGSIIQTDTLEFRKKLDEKESDIIMHAIAVIKERYNNLSKEVIVPFKIDLDYENFKFTVPKAGDKKSLLELSYKNALYYYNDIQKKKFDSLEKKESALNNLLETVKSDLRLKKLPTHIECFDNSNLQGSNPVSSMVIFKNGKSYNKGYRHYNIKTVDQIDDFASMAEVISRRYKRLLKEKDSLPQLIVVDGGKGQLSIAYKILKELKIDDKIEIIGIAKKLEEIYKPGESLPLFIDKRSPTNNLIQQLRNEAHRFAITHHRNQRIRTSIKTDLMEIEGVGKKTAEKLLTHFKSVKKIKDASVDELTGIVGKIKANAIRKALSKKQ